MSLIQQAGGWPKLKTLVPSWRMGRGGRAQAAQAGIHTCPNRPVTDSSSASCRSPPCAKQVFFFARAACTPGTCLGSGCSDDGAAIGVFLRGRLPLRPLPPLPPLPQLRVVPSTFQCKASVSLSPVVQFASVNLATTLGPLSPQVCGDTGGATRLVLCENVDAGCLGGVHLYCCVPLRSEPPSEAWYCSECQVARKEAAAARLRAYREREAARQQRRVERQQQKAQHKRKRQEEREAERRARRRQEEEQRRAASAAAPARPKALPNSVTGLPAVPRQSSGVAAVIAAASGRAAPGGPPAAGKPPTAAASGTAGRAAAGPGAALASKDTLSFLFSSLSKEDARQKEQEDRERQRIANMLRGDARRMQGSQAEHVRGARWRLCGVGALWVCEMPAVVIVR